MTCWRLAAWQSGAKKARPLRAFPHLEHLEARNLSTKSLVFVPSPSVSGLELLATTAIAHNDMWAVGNVVVPGATQPHAVHFDGTKWSLVSTPSFTNDSLSGIAAVASNDVWAVGTLFGSKWFREHLSSTGMAPAGAWSPAPLPRTGAF
jgi:hypothetical protein